MTIQKDTSGPKPMAAAQAAVRPHDVAENFIVARSKVRDQPFRSLRGLATQFHQEITTMPRFSFTLSAINAEELPLIGETFLDQARRRFLVVAEQRKVRLTLRGEETFAFVTAVPVVAGGVR